MTERNQIPAGSPVAGRPAGESPNPGSSPGKPALSLPFDPLRLVAALIRHSWLMILGAGLLAAGAAAFGHAKFQNLYTATAQLMRQESAGTFRASELGQPFKPRELSVSTLVSFMKSPPVLQGVANQVTPHLTPSAILGALMITPERNTDLITVSFKSSRSAQAAINVLNIFGAEVVRLTRDLQGQEATEVNRLLKHQLAKSDEEVRLMNEEMLKFSKEAGVVSVDKETDAYLSKLGSLDMKFETTRIDFETLDTRIHALERELLEHNPLAEHLQTAKDKLAELRANYTETNPVVEDAKEKVTELEKQVKETSTQLVAPRQGDTGPAVGFYQELVTLRTQKEVLAAQLEKLKAVRQEVESQLHTLPEKGIVYARLRSKQQALETSRALLGSRQREAQIYEDNPPGYYRFFEAKVEDIETTSRAKKLIIAAVAGGFLGTMFSAFFICLVESLDDRIKTQADAKRATKLPWLASLPLLRRKHTFDQAGWAFRTWMSLRSRLGGATEQPIICAFVGLGSGDGLSTWIQLLAQAAALRESAVVAITNHPPENTPVTSLGEALANPAAVPLARGTVRWLVLETGWRWDSARRTSWRNACEQWQSTPGLVVLLELKDAELPETLLLAECVPHLVWVAAAGKAKVAATNRRLEIMRNAHCPVAGMVINREKKLFPWSKVGT